MNKILGFELVTGGLMLGGLGYLAHHLVPELADVTLITGLAGGVLCVLWGVLAVLGSRRKAWPILTLIPITIVMLMQSVMNWMPSGAATSATRTAAILSTLMMAFSFALLTMIVHAGTRRVGNPFEESGGPVRRGNRKTVTDGTLKAR